MTGGLQFQVTDGEDWFGVGIEPSSKAVIGSQDVPYIYEDRISREDFLGAMTKLYEMTPAERSAMGQKGTEFAHKEFNFDDYTEKWDTLFTKIVDEHGSWDTREQYKPYNVRVF